MMHEWITMKEVINLLIKNGKIVTVNKDRLIITDGAIGIKGKFIIDINKTGKLIDKYAPEKIIDAKGKVILPGLWDNHSHLSQSLVKSLTYGEPIPLGLTYMPFGEALSQDDIYIAAQLSCLENIKTGVACITDVGSSSPNIVAKAAEESGLRVIISKSMIDKEIPNFPYSHPLPPGSTTEKAITDAEAFFKRWNGVAEGRIRVGLATNIWGTSDELYVETKKIADKYNLNIHDHLDQHRHEIEYSIRTWKKRPVEHLDELGILGPNFNAHHMVYVGDREIPILIKNDVKICHNPRAALNSHGIPKTPLFVALGLTCTLGTDMRTDMFEVMRLASYMHHGTWGLYYYDPLVLSAEDILQMITINAAKSNLIDKDTGSLEIGKRADVTIVDFNKPHLTPSYDIIAELTRYAYGSDVDTLIVDGNILMEERKIKTMDEKSIIEKAQEIGYLTYKKTESAISKSVPINRWKVI